MTLSDEKKYEVKKIAFWIAYGIGVISGFILCLIIKG